MRFNLKVVTVDNANDYSLGRHFRFAVIDEDKACKYPANFVCLLPLAVTPSEKSNNIFFKLFGDNSLEQAKQLLNKALKTENNAEVKAEISRRLILLEPKTNNQMKCSDCGKAFAAKRSRRYSKNLCRACLIKKYGNHQ